MKVSGIYAINDALTGECLYVGQSKDITTRWRHHLNKLAGGRHLKAFNAWFDGIGHDLTRIEFAMCEFVESNDKLLNAAEIHWFQELEPLFYGKVPSENEEWQHSDETRAKIAASVKEGYFEKRGGNAFRQVPERVCEVCGVSYRPKGAAVKKHFCSAECYRSTYANLARLSDQEFMDLHNKDGHSWSEISRMFGVSTAAVSLRLRKIRQTGTLPPT